MKILSLAILFTTFWLFSCGNNAAPAVTTTGSSGDTIVPGNVIKNVTTVPGHPHDTTLVSSNATSITIRVATTVPGHPHDTTSFIRVLPKTPVLVKKFSLDKKQ